MMAAAAAPMRLLLGDGIADDTLLHIARFLPTVRDLLCLGLTCPRFAAKIIAAVPAEPGPRAAAAAAPEMLSLVEEAARLSRYMYLQKDGRFENPFDKGRSANWKAAVKAALSAEGPVRKKRPNLVAFTCLCGAFCNGSLVVRGQGDFCFVVF